MRRFLLSAVAASALFAPSAFADVTVTGDVYKLVDIDINEDIDKVKFVFLDVIVVNTPDKFAEAQTVFNQRNENNKACENCAEKIDEIRNSISGNVGITSVNQSSGNSNNQGTAISFAYDLDQPPVPPSTSDGFAESQVAVAQYMQNNTINSINIVFRDALMYNSVLGNIGITAVNQSAGNINNQGNAISIAFSLSPGVALSDVALGQWNTGNSVFESNVSKQAVINASISLNTGITQVNQSAGNLGNQLNAVSLAVTN
jgi:hypothetical protein